MTAACVVEGCDIPSKVRGWCGMHYQRHISGRPMDAPRQTRMDDRGCSVDGCTGKHNASGFCLRHYMADKRWGDPLSTAATRPPLPRKVQPACSVEGCDVPQSARGLCAPHYQRWYKYDDPTMSKPHPRQDVVGYTAAHGRLYRDQGKASTHLCVECGEPAADWAYDHTDPDELTEMWGGRMTAYSLDQSHYQPMCNPCHGSLDYWHSRGGQGSGAAS